MLPSSSAYAIASMCVSIVIAGSFQVLFFRTPARRKLRLDIAAVTFGLSSYNTLLQSYINAVAPADETPTPPAEALATIQSVRPSLPRPRALTDPTLVRRNSSSARQSYRLRSSPSLPCTSLQPSSLNLHFLSKAMVSPLHLPPRGTELILYCSHPQGYQEPPGHPRSIQGGSHGVGYDGIQREDPQGLYQQGGSQYLSLLRGVLMLCTDVCALNSCIPTESIPSDLLARSSTSQQLPVRSFPLLPTLADLLQVLSKTPLPRDVPSSRSTWASFENDVLVLSRRLSQHARGEEELHSNGFLRYWLYLASIHSVSSELEDLEVLLGEVRSPLSSSSSSLTFDPQLFGVPEDTNPNLS